MPDSVIMKDGMLDFSGGVNSLKPTTVASPNNPNGLARNQLAWLINGTVRGNGITPRNGMQYLVTVADGSSVYQGGSFYRPLSGSPYLVVSIGGQIYRIRVDTDNSVENISGTSFLNPTTEPEAFFCQGEEFLVIQAGDNLTLPLFWDGNSLRRSLGQSIQYGTTALNFTVPNVGSIVLVTLTSPYTGAPGQQVLVNGKQYQVGVGDLANRFITLKNLSQFSPGAGIPPGTGIFRLPDYVSRVQILTTPFPYQHFNVEMQTPYTFSGPNQGLYINGIQCSLVSQSDSTHIVVSGPLPGAQRTQLFNTPPGAGIALTVPVVNSATLESGFVVPAIGQTVSTLLKQPYTGSINQPVRIAGAIYEVVSIGAPPTGVNQVYLTNLGDTPGATVLAGETLDTIAELPAATAMDYFMGRLWYAQGRTYVAGDIVRGPSGSKPYDFRDSILKITENPLAIGGDGFTVPSNAGNIRALKHTSELDTSLGQGDLYIGTSDAIYRLKVPVSRTDWINANDSTQPLQTVAQIKYGPVNDRSVVQVNGDLFYQTLEPGIRSLILAIRYFQQWANVPISRNEQRVLRFNDRSLLRFASGIEFSNRLLQTALPIQTPVGVAFQAVVPLDFDLISTLEEKQPPAWEGMYEGLDILQLFEADFGGRQRAFAMVHSRTDHSIQLWELTDYLRSDFNKDGEARIKWLVEFPALTWNREFELKLLNGGELWVDRVYGTVDFKLEYRPDGEQCWQFWNQWQICSARNSCEDAFNPICYPITQFAEGFRQTMKQPLPQDGCISVSGRPPNVLYQAQIRLTITGWCRIRGYLLYAQNVEQETYNHMYCPGITPTAAFTPQATVSPQASDQIVSSSLPTVPTIGITTQVFPLGTIVDNGVDPAVCVHAFCGDIFMEIEPQLGGNAKLFWNQPIEPGIVASLLLYRSTDNVNYTLIQQFNNPATDAAARSFDYTDPEIPALKFFYRMDGVSIFGDRWSYNVVSITRTYQLNVQGAPGGNVLTWNAPVL